MGKRGKTERRGESTSQTPRTVDTSTVDKLVLDCSVKEHLKYNNAISFHLRLA